jgi:hypothetical protein
MMKSAMVCSCLWALLAAPTAPAQRPEPAPEPELEWANGSDAAPGVQLWIAGDRRSTRAEPFVRSRYDSEDYGGPGRPATSRVRFRVDGDAYVTVVSLDSDGRVRILYPESATDDSLLEAGLVVDVPVPEEEIRRAGQSTGYAIAIAASEPADYRAFRDRGRWRTRYFERPRVITQDRERRPAAIDRIARDLYPDWRVAYSVDFVPYRTALGGGFAADRGYDGYEGYGVHDGYSAYESQIAYYGYSPFALGRAECAYLAASWGLPAWDVWSPLGRTCVLGAYGYGPFRHRHRPLWPPAGPVAPREYTGVDAGRDARRAMIPRRAVPRTRDPARQATPRPRPSTAEPGLVGRDAERAVRRRPPTGLVGRFERQLRAGSRPATPAPADRRTWRPAPPDGSTPARTAPAPRATGPAPSRVAPRAVRAEPPPARRVPATPAVTSGVRRQSPPRPQERE